MGSLGSTECYIPIDSTAAQILECQYLCRIPHRALNKGAPLLLSKRSPAMDAVAHTATAHHHPLLFCKRSEGKMAMRVAPTFTWLVGSVLGRNLDRGFSIDAFKSDRRCRTAELV